MAGQANGADCHRLWRGAATGGINLLDLSSMYLTYILYSLSTLRYYIGHTQDINERLARHNRGLVRSTKYGRPWIVVYSEEFNTKNEAYRREVQIKSYKGGVAFKKLVNLWVGTEAVKRGRL